MSQPVEGIYAAYLSGRVGHGVAMLLFSKGLIAGADSHGVKFDGSYVETSLGSVAVEMAVMAPPNVALIQGGLTGEEGDQYTIKVDLPPDFPNADYVAISTKHGPINARIRKIRGLDG